MRPVRHLWRLLAQQHIIALLFLAGCTGPEPAGTAASAESTKLDPAALLANMPMNDGERCSGIALVAEALLDGETDDATDTPEIVAHRLYESLFGGQRLKYPARLLLDGVPRSMHVAEVV